MHLATRLVVCSLFALIGGVVVATAQSPTHLIDAAKRQDIAAVRTLLSKRVDVNGQAADGSTALHWAAQRNNPQLVDLLVRAGASAKASTRYNVPPLYSPRSTATPASSSACSPPAPTPTAPCTRGRRC
jgi:hypothetical protein